MEITLFFPFVVKTPKRGKSYEAPMRSRLLVVLLILVIIGLLLIVVIVGRNMSRANAESSQLVRSK
jgi:cytoskeletal protein RodZ